MICVFLKKLGITPIHGNLIGETMVSHWTLKLLPEIPRQTCSYWMAFGTGCCFQHTKKRNNHRSKQRGTNKHAESVQLSYSPNFWPTIFFIRKDVGNIDHENETWLSVKTVVFCCSPKNN